MPAVCPIADGEVRVSIRTAEDEARATARARKDAQQRAEAEAVWKQVRKDEQTLLDRTARLRAERLERDEEERKRAAAAAAPKAKAASTRPKRARSGANA